jgi:hypothetical protein
MAEVPKEHKETITQHLGDGESVRKAAIVGPTVVAVTDRRLIEVTRTGTESGVQEREETKSIPFEEVQCLESYYQGKEPVDQEELIAGGISMAVGVFSLFGAVSANEPGMAGIAGVIGLVFFFAGLYFLMSAYDRGDGGRQLELTTAYGDVERFPLPPKSDDFVAAASVTLGEGAA